MSGVPAMVARDEGLPKEKESKMGKPRQSAVASGASFAAEVWLALDRAVRKYGGSDDDVHRLGRPEGAEFLDELARKLVACSRKVFRAVADYGNALHLEVDSCKYDWANENITHLNFPSDKRGTEEVDLELLHFDRVMNSEEVIAECDRLGYRLANLREGLAFSRTYKDEQRKGPVVILGSSCMVVGGRHVPYLYGDSTDRNLDLYWFARGWSSGCRFLVVRK